MPDHVNAEDDLVERLRQQREHFIAEIIGDGAILQDVKKWLQQCHDWLLTNDLDMTCPMETDPLDLIERIDRSFGMPSRQALNQGTPNVG